MLFCFVLFCFAFLLNNSQRMYILNSALIFTIFLLTLIYKLFIKLEFLFTHFIAILTLQFYNFKHVAKKCHKFPALQWTFCKSFPSAIKCFLVISVIKSVIVYSISVSKERMFTMCTKSGIGQFHSSLIPDFLQKSWNFYTIRSVYLYRDCMLNLTCTLNLVTKICEFSLQRPFIKVYF